MRIVLDMQGAQTESRFRGIGRYTISLTRAIIRNRGEHEIILALSGLFPNTIAPIRNLFDDLLPQDNIRVWYAPGPVKESEPGNKIRRAVAEKIREQFLCSLEPDIIHIFSPFEGYGDESITVLKNIIHTHVVTTTVYDLIPLIYQDSYLNHHPAYKAHYLSKVEFIKETAAVITISESSKSEIASYLGNYPGKITNCYLGADNIFCKSSTSDVEISTLKEKLNIRQSFILYTGGADERKNLHRLIEAYSELSEPLITAYQLVFAGKISESEKGKLEKIAKQKLIDNEQLIFTGYITDHELNILLNICDLFIFPSWHEGFGLPALEAMKCGAAVIGSDKTSIPEVINNPDALFDPFSVQSISNKIEEVLLSHDFRNELKKHGLEQAKKFTWDDSAQCVLETFETITKSKNLKQTTSKETDNDLDKVIKQLSCGNSMDEKELAGVAYCLNKSFPEKNRKTQILIDISGIGENESSTTTALIEFLYSILLEFNPKLTIRPVFSSNEKSQYFYCDDLSEIYKIPPNLVNSGKSQKVEIWNGDIFLISGFNTDTLFANSEILQHWQDQGAIVKTFICNPEILNPEEHGPTTFSYEAKRWLQETEKYSGVICTSEVMAKNYLSLMSNENPNRRISFRVDWFPLELQNQFKPTENLIKTISPTKELFLESLTK